MFAGLSKAANMNLYRFGQSRNHEIPFAGQSIAPASGRNLRLEVPLHQFQDFSGVRIGIEIQIAAEIRPMIERFDYRSVITLAFKFRADLVQILHCRLNPGLFSGKRTLRPFCARAVPLFAHDIEKHTQPTHDHVVQIRQID